MITLLLAAQATLSFPAGIYTYPDIAAKMSIDGKKVSCDATVANRAAFLFVPSISREELLRALDLTVRPYGSSNRLVSVHAKQERQWIAGIASALGKRYDRILAASVTASLTAGAGEIKEDWAAPMMKILRDPNSTSSERKAADDRFIEEFGKVIAGGEDSIANTALVSVLSEFPTAVPPETFNYEVVTESKPYTALSPGTRAALHKAIPELQGGSETVVLRRRRIGMYTGPLGIYDEITIIDPGAIRPLQGGMLAEAIPWRPEDSISGALVGAVAAKEIRLPEFAEHVHASDPTFEAANAKLIAYQAELTPGAVPNRSSLSELAELWAEKHHPVIVELEPLEETIGEKMPVKGLSKSSDWWASLVGDVLVLRPKLGFLQSNRRYPYEALRSLELAKVPRPNRQGMRSWPGAEAMKDYVRLAGPFDTWGLLSYRGWDGYLLDSAARSLRVTGLVPPAVLSEAEKVKAAHAAEYPPVDVVRAPRKLRTTPLGQWEIPLAELSEPALAVLSQEMGADTSNFSNAIVYAAPAWRRFLSSGRISVTVIDSMNGPMRAITISSPKDPLFSGAANVVLYGY